MIIQKSRKRKSTISETREYYFDGDEVQHRLDFMRDCLVYPKGDMGGKPFIPMEWEVERIIKPLFGWKRKDNGLRRYRTLFEYVPRKNDKTTMGSALILTCFFLDQEFGAELYNVATSLEQARISFNISKTMIESSKALMSSCEIYKNSIVRPGTHSTYKVLSSDADTKDGLNSSVILYDEIHEWPGRDLYDKLNTSTLSRKQPLEIITTTAGTYDPTAIWMEVYNYAKRVQSGEIVDETYLPVIYEADQADPDFDPFDEELWQDVNPGWGISIDVEKFKLSASRAKNTPSYLNTFKRYHLNIITKSTDVWIPAHVWNANPVKKNPLEFYKGRQCFIGVDLANYHDLLPVSLIFPNKDGETVDEIIEYWVTHDKAADRKTKGEADYFTWRDQGYVNITPGNVADYQIIRKRIGEYSSVYGININVIGYDDWNASQFAQDLASDGANINPWSPSNAKLWNAPTKKMEAMATAGQINHMGNPVLAWNVENTVIRYNGEYIKPDKGKSKDKIDGVIATIIAIGEWMNYVPEPPKSHGLGL